jgi:hypothetical protein
MVPDAVNFREHMSVLKLIPTKKCYGKSSSKCNKTYHGQQELPPLLRPLVKISPEPVYWVPSYDDDISPLLLRSPNILIYIYKVCARQPSSYNILYL